MSETPQEKAARIAAALEMVEQELAQAEARLSAACDATREADVAAVLDPGAKAEAARARAAEQMEAAIQARDELEERLPVLRQALAAAQEAATAEARAGDEARRAKVRDRLAAGRAARQDALVRALAEELALWRLQGGTWPHFESLASTIATKLLSQPDRRVDVLQHAERTTREVA